MITDIIIHGSIYSALFSIAVLMILLKSPRIMLQDYPKEIIQKVPPKSVAEKKLSKAYFIPIVVVLLCYPLTVGYSHAVHNSWNFWQTFFFVWGIMLFGNLYDLLIVDWLVFCLITPRFMVLPGTEGDKAYKDYFFHFIGFIKGIGITFVLAVGVSGAIKLVGSL